MYLVVKGRTLRQDGTHPDVGSINLNNKLFLGIRSDEDGSGGKQPLKPIKRILSSPGPRKASLGRVEASKQGGDTNKIPDKTTVKIGKPQKPLKRDSRIWNRPINDSTNLVRVHADPLRLNHRTEKRDRLGMKHALFCLDKQVVLK